MNQTLNSTIATPALRVARRRFLRPLTLLIGLFMVGSLGALAVLLAGMMPSKRVPNQSVIMPLSPPSSTAWTVENAFPNLKFFEPTCLVRDPIGGRIFVLERRGTVQAFSEDSKTSDKRQVLDLSSRVSRTAYEDDGAMGLVLHPEFGQADSPKRGFFYLFYTAKSEGQRFDRLSQFDLSGDQAGDETILIDQVDDNLWHNGGALAFGPDGFLYVGVGDEGTDGDGLSNGQRIDRDFFCGILRIDVDRVGGDVSHPPIRQPDSGKTANYFVPNDNPFVGVPGALEEFWAHGLRNPFRMAFDRATGKLWAADVGHLRREEINIIERGGNYGWSYREGRLPFTESYLAGQAPEPLVGIEQLPFREYPHLNGDNCIIGGFVYRGEQHPSLQGKYLYGDNGSGRLWAIDTATDSEPENVELASLPVSSKTGVSAIVEGTNGEPWVVVLGESDTTSGTIHRLVPAPPGSSTTLPETLSATGIFEDTATLTPSDGVFEYAVNAGQSLGEVSVRRWVMLPGNGDDPDPTADRIGFNPASSWNFPVGTVFVQHLELTAEVAGGRRSPRLETRILVRHALGGVYGATYRWNSEGTDASLLTEPASEDLKSNAAHAIDGQRWHYLSGRSCLACHSQNAGYVLGVNARQINRLFRQPGRFAARNQIAAWSRMGMFRDQLDEQVWTEGSRLVNPTDATADLGLRARSFLDVNCASCHRPGGARANFYAGFAATADPHFAGSRPTQGDFGIAGARIVTPGDPFRSVLYYRLAKLGPGRMPLVGSQRLDIEGLDLMKAWIEQLPPATEVDPESAELTEQWDRQDESLARLAVGDSAEGLELLLSDSRSGFGLWQLVFDGGLSIEVEDEVTKAGIVSTNPAVRDLFEWLVPAAERTQRLGAQFDSNNVLALAGDAERGRTIFQELAGLDCRGCHSLQRGEQIIGPSLWGIGDKYDRSQLLEHIIDPSQKVDAEFSSWLLETASGRIFSGLKIAESDHEVVLKDATGKEIRVPADDVHYLESLPKSLMPEQLLQTLTPQQAADLLDFLHSLKKAYGSVAGA